MARYKLQRHEIDEIMDYQKTDTVRKMILFTRPNYYTFCLKQDKSLLDKVYDSLKWELHTYPLHQHHHYYNYIGVYFAIRGYPGKAIEYLLEAVRLKPQSEVTLANIIILLCDTDKRDQAAIYLKRLTELKKNQGEVSLDLGLLFQLFNLNVAARQLYDKYLAGHQSAFNDFVMFQFGKVLLAHCSGKMFYDNNVDKAIKIFVEVNKREPHFLPGILSLVEALNLKWRQSQKRAVTHPHVDILVQKLGKRKYENNSHALYLIGRILMKQKNYEEAREFLEKSVNILPTVDNHYQLGKCMLKQQRLLKAESHFKEAQRISKVFSVKVVLKEATALVEIGRRIDALRLLGTVPDNNLNRHDKAALELFSAEQNIMAVPDVTATLDNTLKLLYKSFSRKIYHRFIKVVKLFTEHLSTYYTTTGLPQSQAELFLKWVKFLQDKGEITEEKSIELTKIKDYMRNQNLHGRRMSVARGPGPNMARRRSSTTTNMSRRRSSVRSVTTYQPIPQIVSPDNTSPDHHPTESIPENKQHQNIESSPRSRRKSALNGLRPMDNSHIAPSKQRKSYILPLPDQICEES